MYSPSAARHTDPAEVLEVDNNPAVDDLAVADIGHTVAAAVAAES